MHTIGCAAVLIPLKRAAMHPPPVPCPANPPPLLERVRRAARARGDFRPTADHLVTWARAFILFHHKRHPGPMGLPEVTHFLEHVVQTGPDPLPALAQAREALTLPGAGRALTSLSFLILCR
jgi:Phage integrase, N-terminal SAM-like domain